MEECRLEMLLVREVFGQVGAPLLQIPASILLRIPIVNLHQCRQSGASARNKNLPAPKTHKMEIPLPTQFGPDRFIESERRDQPRSEEHTSELQSLRHL